MTSPVEVFQAVAAPAATRPGVFRNARGNLVADDGEVRAMTSKGAIVVRLDLDGRLSAERCRELVNEALRPVP
jgi:hypothetical protein